MSCGSVIYELIYEGRNRKYQNYIHNIYECRYQIILNIFIILLTKISHFFVKIGEIYYLINLYIPYIEKINKIINNI